MELNKDMQHIFLHFYLHRYLSKKIEQNIGNINDVHLTLTINSIKQQITIYYSYNIILLNGKFNQALYIYS